MNGDDVRREPPPPAMAAARDQAMAAARDQVEPLGGRIVDTRDALLTCVVDGQGVAHLSTTATKGNHPDWRWVAESLHALANNATAKADRLGL